MNADEADKPDPPAAAATVVALAEDEISIGKRQVVTGRVRLRTVTDVAEELVREDLQGVRAEIERVPIDRVLDAGESPPVPRTEGDVTIVPVVEEVLVVEKRLRVKEEVRLVLRPTSDSIEVPVTVRKQRAVIERVDVEDPLNAPHHQARREED